MSIKISTGKVKSAYRGGRIPLRGTRLIPTGDIVFLSRGGHGSSYEHFSSMGSDPMETAGFLNGC